MLWQKTLPLVFLVVIVPLAIYGGYVQYRTATQIAPAIRQTLVEPYIRALQAGDYATAYQQFTSAAFKAAHPLAAYLEAQRINQAGFGPLVVVALQDSEPFQKLSEKWLLLNQWLMCSSGLGCDG